MGGAGTATMTGSGTWKGLSGHTFEITVVDKGSPGYRKGDTITVVIRNPSGTPVFSWGPEPLKTGDIAVTTAGVAPPRPRTRSGRRLRRSRLPGFVTSLFLLSEPTGR